MPEITALIIDSREPAWVQNLKFNGIPTTVSMLETGDVLAVTSDNHTLVIERKTNDDFLNSLKDDRLFPQLARMAEIRNAQQNLGQPITNWPYLLITDPFVANRDGKVITQRGVTGWSFSAVMGTILSIQEMGVFVIFCNGDADFQDCILRLGRRSRDPEMRILPPRPANILGPKYSFLMGLPGMGIDRVQDILDWSENNIGHALIGLTDVDIKSPIGLSLRLRLRALMGLRDGENLEITGTQITEPILEGVMTNEQTVR